MKLKKIELSGFGVLSHCEIEFSDGQFNLILGKNETGKSTLCRAIASILYGFPSKEEAKAGKSWQFQGDYRGSLVLEFNGADVVFERAFDSNHLIVRRADGSSDEVLFDGDANPRGRTEQPKAYRKLLDQLGFPAETVFRSALYVGQQELEVQIDDELRQQISGAGSADYLKARSGLQARYYELTREALSGDNPKRADRKLEEARAKLQTLANEYDQACSQSTQLTTVESDLGESTRAYEDLLAKKKELETENGLLTRFLDQLAQLESLKGSIKLEEQHRERTERTQKTVEDIEQQLSSERFSSFQKLSGADLQRLESYVQSDAEQTLQDIQGLQARAAAVRAELNDERFSGFAEAPETTGTVLKQLIESKAAIAELQKQTSTVVHESPSHSPRSMLLVCAGMGTLGLVAGALLGSLLHFNVLISGFLGFTMLGLLAIAGFLVLSLFQTDDAEENKKKQLTLQVQLAEKRSLYERQLKEVESILPPENADVLLEVLLDRWGQFRQRRDELERLEGDRTLLSKRDALLIRDDANLKDIIASAPAATLRDRLRDYNDLRTRLHSNQENLGSLATSSEQANLGEGVTDRYRQAVALIDELESEEPSLKAYRANLEAGFARQGFLKRSLDSISANLAELDGRIRSLEIQRGQLQVAHYRNPELIKEDEQTVDEEIQRLKMRASALRLAIETLDEAIQEYEQSYVSRLSKQLSEYFSAFTGGRYASVEVIPGQTPSICTHDGIPLDSGLLSAGARDQLFFALRLAIADIMSAEISLPLILDDTFVNFDDKRLDAVRSTLESLLHTKQIILLSHSSAYESWGGQLFKMQ